MTDIEKQWLWRTIVPCVVLLAAVIWKAYDAKNWHIKELEQENLVEECQNRMDQLATASFKVVQLNYQRDSIIQPVIAKSKALNEKYNKSVDTSLTGDLATFIRNFTDDTKSFNRDSL